MTAIQKTPVKPQPIIRQQPIGTPGPPSDFQEPLPQNLGLVGLHSHVGCITVADDDHDVRLWSQRHQLQASQEIQRHLLPNRYPTVPGCTFQAHSTLGSPVGGDYYNFLWVNNQKLGIVIADVSGKGIQAALIAAMLAGTFRTQSWGNKDVRDVLCRVNDFIRSALKSGTFITCIYGILDVPTLRLTWARAGHEPLLLKRAHAPVEVLTPFGFPLGLCETAELRSNLEVEQTQLQPGDRMLFFTDGLTEAMNAQGEEFGLERIVNALNEDQDLVNPNHGGKADLSGLEAAVRAHVGSEPLHDDLTLVHLAVQSSCKKET